MSRTDLVLALALAAGTVMSRVPVRARLLPTWDAIQFALALHDYDIVKHQPHPPGYILYVGAARTLETFLGSPTGSLTYFAIAASAVTVFLVYGLAHTLYDRVTAVVAATLLSVSPLFWLYSAMPLPYAVEAALVTAVATLVWPMRGGQARFAVWSSLALGLASGVRQSILVLLSPLWLGMATRGLHRFRPVFGGCALIALTAAASFLPMVWLTGGLDRYLGASLELFDSTVRATTVIGPPGGWRANLRGLLEASLLGVGVLLPTLAWLVVRGLRGVAAQWGIPEWFFAAWIVPPLLVYTVVHFGQHGYLLTVLPALYILMARRVVVTVQGARLMALVAGVVLIHATFFIAAGPMDVPEIRSGASGVEEALAGARAFYRFRIWGNTARGLREQENVIRTYVESIRQGFDPNDTALVTELGNPRSYPWFRHVRYYLPEFSVYHVRVGHYRPGYLSSQHPESMATIDSVDIPLTPNTRRLVWIVDYWNPTLPRPANLQERELPYGRKLYVLELEAHAVEHGAYRLVPATARL